MRVAISLILVATSVVGGWALLQNDAVLPDSHHSTGIDSPFITTRDPAVSQLPNIETPGFAAAIQQNSLLATVRVINQKKDDLAVGAIIGMIGPATYIL